MHLHFKRGDRRDIFGHKIGALEGTFGAFEVKLIH